MSIFDRLGNLGKGILKSTFSDSGSTGAAEPVSDHLSQLRQAYASGVLTEAEYTRKREELLARLTAASPRPAASTPRSPAAPAGDAPEVGDAPVEPWDEPVKRTL